MEPTAKRVKETNGRGRNIHLTDNRNDFKVMYSRSSNNFLKQKTAEKGYYGKNEYNQSTVHVFAAPGGVKEIARERVREKENDTMGKIENVGVGIGAGMGGVTWRGIETMPGVKERNTRRTCNKNTLIMNNRSFYLNPNVPVGTSSTTFMSPVHPFNVNMKYPQNKNMFHTVLGLEHKRINEQNMRFHHKKVPMPYEPLKYPAFKMVDRLKNGKKDINYAEKEKEETVEVKKEKEHGHEHIDKYEMEKKQKENETEQAKEIEWEEKTTSSFSENADTENEKWKETHIQKKVEEIEKKDKYKYKIKKYEKELKHIEEINKKKGMVDDNTRTKQIPCSSGEVNIYNNKENEEIKEFLSLSLNPSNTTINPQKITNEIKFILHMTLLTLYRDQIKPTYRKIKKRLKCFSENFEIKYNFLNIYALLQNQYIIVRSKNNNVFVLLRETPKWFLGWVNTKSFTNIYPKNVWKYFITYLLDISKAKREYSYSPFLLKFMNYLKQNKFLFYVQSKIEDSLLDNENNKHGFFHLGIQNEENEDSFENSEEKIYHYIERNKSFSFFSYLDTFYKKKRETAFCDLYISFLKKEEKSLNMKETMQRKTNDDTSFQKKQIFLEKDMDMEKEMEREVEKEIKKEKEMETEMKKEKEKEKERKEEETRSTRMCYEKYKNIFNSKENVLGVEKNTKIKNEWEFDNDIYEMANFLKKMNFPFFKNYSLGKIAHIVQLSLYNGLLLEEDGCIKPACAIRNIVSFVFYFKDLINENEEKKEVIEEKIKKEEKEKEKEKEKEVTGKLIFDMHNIPTFVEENNFIAKEEKTLFEKDLFYNESYLDESFCFGYSGCLNSQKWINSQKWKSGSEKKMKTKKEKRDMEKDDIFEQMLNDVREMRAQYGTQYGAQYEQCNLKGNKRELFHWKYLFSNEESDMSMSEKEFLSCDKNEYNTYITTSRNVSISETCNNLKIEQPEKWENNLQQKQNDERVETLAVIKDLEEAKVKIQRLLKRSYKNQIFLYLFREKFYKKYKEAINPLYFGYHSLIEFLFYACREACKIYILNKNIILLHPSCNINYSQNKKENVLQPFSYLDYFYSAPEKKKEIENKIETKNKNEQNEKFENHSLEICTIMKNLAKKKNNFFITFYFWKKWNTKNKSILNEVSFLRDDYY